MMVIAAAVEVMIVIIYNLYNINVYSLLIVILKGMQRLIVRDLNFLRCPD